MGDGPPYRAEHIGSLLRPPRLLEARRRLAAGEAAPDELARAQEQAIAAVVRLQERLGFKLATDGEFRRRSYHSYFYAQLGDVTPDALAEAGSGGADGRAPQPSARVNSKLKWTRPIHVADFESLSARTGLTPKITIPGPCALHFRGGDAAVTARAYADVDEFWRDTVEAFSRELSALAAAGCTYVQIDETAFAKFGDAEVREALAARGDDWRRLIDLYIDVTNRVLRAAPAGVRIGMHLCRGNRGGRWHAQGSYDAVADKLFNRLEIGFYFLEYDSARAGTFAPLRFLPSHKSVVLGLVSTKMPQLESKDELKRRVEEASRYVDLARLGLSPQCGFASIDAGNPLSFAEQEAKLHLVVETAEEIWKSP
jgi:5-methyltetrahydropteroyltriglutamate--homocysteine methyltransferase